MRSFLRVLHYPPPRLKPHRPRRRLLEMNSIAWINQHNHERQPEQIDGVDEQPPRRVGADQELLERRQEP